MSLDSDHFPQNRPHASLALKNQIEAVLYLKGEPLDLASIAELAGCSRDHAYEALLELIEDYAHRDSALEVLAVEKGFALQLREPFLPLVNQILPPELGVGAMRTLATIILKGPLSQPDLVDLRGGSAYQQVAELVEKGFVTRYRPSGSRAYWLRVTHKFHQYFSVDELASATLDEPDPAGDEATSDLPLLTPEDAEK
ncbi:MAG: SMC-Scp complex subunit ScpB [Synechococcaceae cyanobacterium SM2_3_1]|nr:SMC-Scp complex subunit ScpB [Synechococcaceae cyanobacterium SM2_3_1]